MFAALLATASCSDPGGPESPRLHLSITASLPSALAEDDTFGLVIEALDSAGDRDTTFAGMVTVRLTGGPAGVRLQGTDSAAAVAGRATIGSLSVDSSSADYRLIVSSPGLTPDTSNGFGVAAAPVASMLVFQQHPNDAYHPADMASVWCRILNCYTHFAVAAVDSAGRVATRFRDTVEITLGVNPTGVSYFYFRFLLVPERGVARRSFIPPRGAGFTLVASTGSFAPVESRPFTGTGDGPTGLRLEAIPGSPTAGSPFSLRVTVRDPYGGTVFEANGDTVFATIDSMPPGGVLTGDLRGVVANGVALLGGLVAQPAGRYVLRASWITHRADPLPIVVAP